MQQRMLLLTGPPLPICCKVNIFLTQKLLNVSGSEIKPAMVHTETGLIQCQ